MLKLLWHFCSVWLLRKYFFISQNGLDDMKILNISDIRIVWKSNKMSHIIFLILAFSTNFCPFKINMSGNTAWPQASGLQKLAKLDHFWNLDFFLGFHFSLCWKSQRKKEWNSFDKWNILQILQKFTRTIFFVKKKTLSS